MEDRQTAALLISAIQAEDIPKLQVGPQMGVECGAALLNSTWEPFTYCAVVFTKLNPKHTNS
jgi:hypothetical protein